MTSNTFKNSIITKDFIYYNIMYLFRIVSFFKQYKVIVFRKPVDNYYN